MRDTPFEYLHHLVVVPVLLNGVERRFVLDSGIGIDLVRDSFEECAPTGASFAGKRMSGQEVSLPLAVAPALALGGVERKNAPVGLLDFGGFPPAFDGIDGFLSLAFFAGLPFTVDYERRLIRDGRDAVGTEVPLRIHADGPAVTAFMPLALPQGETVEVEVDMGSDSLILDERFAAQLGIELDGEDVRRVDGVDETGNAYVRTFARLEGAVHPAGAPALAQRDLEVVFQRIIYDGLVGHAFLGNFVVTWDVAAARLTIGRRAA